MSDGKPKRRWTECVSCGLPMYSTVDRCEDCRLGRRANTLAYRRARRSPRAAHTMRQWQQRRETTT